MIIVITENQFQDHAVSTVRDIVQQAVSLFR